VLSKKQATNKSSLLVAFFRESFSLAYFSILKMEDVPSFETLLNFYENTLRRIPEYFVLFKVWFVS
jgi:hypothetical protein